MRTALPHRPPAAARPHISISFGKASAMPHCRMQGGWGGGLIEPMRAAEARACACATKAPCCTPTSGGSPPSSALPWRYRNCSRGNRPGPAHSEGRVPAAVNRRFNTFGAVNVNARALHATPQLVPLTQQALPRKVEERHCAAKEHASAISGSSGANYTWTTSRQAGAQAAYVILASSGASLPAALALGLHGKRL